MGITTTRMPADDSRSPVSADTAQGGQAAPWLDRKHEEDARADTPAGQTLPPIWWLLDALHPDVRTGRTHPGRVCWAVPRLLGHGASGIPRGALRLSPGCDVCGADPGLLPDGEPVGAPDQSGVAEGVRRVGPTLTSTAPTRQRPWASRTA